MFLGVEAILFGALFSTYFILRSGSITWGWSPHRHLGIANTVVLFGSTACFSAAVAALRRGRAARFRTLTFVSLALAALFLAVKGFEYQDDVALALYPRTSHRIALYYVLTAVHALHVVGGMIASGRLAGMAASTSMQPDAALVTRAEITLLYWIFLLLIWIMLVVLFYVW